MKDTFIYALLYEYLHSLHCYYRLPQRSIRFADTSRVCLSVLPLLYWLVPTGGTFLFAYSPLYVILFSSLFSCILTASWIYYCLNKRVTHVQKVAYFGLTAAFNVVSVIIYRQLYYNGSNTELDYIIALITTGCSSAELAIAIASYCLKNLPKPAKDLSILDSESLLPQHIDNVFPQKIVKEKKSRRGGASKIPPPEEVASNGENARNALNLITSSFSKQKPNSK